MAVGGNFTNASTFTHNGGTLTFNGAASVLDIISGGDPFNHVIFNDGGGGATWELEDHQSGRRTIRPETEIRPRMPVWWPMVPMRMFQLLILPIPGL